MADVNEIMKRVMKTAAKIAVERPDLQIDPALPLLREKHPEWFEGDGGKPMKLSDFNILPTDHTVFSIGPVWIDGVRYELAAGGDTLLGTPETDAQKADRLALIALLEATLRVKQQKPTA